MLPSSTSASGMHNFSLPLNVEVADIGTDPTNTYTDRLQPPPPSTWSWEFLLSLDLSPKGICQSGFLGFVWHFHQHLSGRLGGQAILWWHWAALTVVTISELWVVGQGRAGLGQILDRGGDQPVGGWREAVQQLMVDQETNSDKKEKRRQQNYRSS